MKEKEPSITQKSKISFLVQRAIKIQGIHYEYRDFYNFLILFEMVQLAALGHFWVTWVKNLFSWVTPSGFRAVFLCLFSEQHIGDTLGSLGFVLLNDVGILKREIEHGPAVCLSDHVQRGVVDLASGLVLTVLQAEMSIQEQMLHDRGGKPLANLLKEGIILPEDKSAGSVGAEPSLLTLHYFGSAAWAGAYNLFFSHKYFSCFYYFACVDKVLNHTVGSWRG